MSRFFVGQRVRVKWVVDTSRFAKFVGIETHITEMCRPFYSAHQDRVTSGYGVAIDPYFRPGGDQLEPIQPSGHRAGDYSLSDLLDRCRAGEGVVV